MPVYSTLLPVLLAQLRRREKKTIREKESGCFNMIFCLCCAILCCWQLLVVENLLNSWLNINMWGMSVISMWHLIQFLSIVRGLFGNFSAPPTLA